MKKKTRKETSPPPSPDGRCLVRVLSILCGIIILIHAGASFFPRGRIWGINQWAYFSPAVSLSLAVLALLLFIPRVNELVRKILDGAVASFLNLFRRIRPVLPKRVWYAVCSLLFFIPFWLLRDRTHFLGDGAQIISHMSSGQLGVKWSEPLEIFLHLKTFQLAHGLWQMGSTTLYALLSCLSGVLFVFLLLLFADFWVRGTKERVLVFTVLFTMGSVQLFFGYVEHYSFVYLFTAAYVFSSLAYLEGKLKWFFPVGAFVLAILSHVMASYLFPSLLLLFFIKSKDAGLPSVRRKIIVALGILVLGAGFTFYKINSWAVPPIFVPLSVDTYSAPGYLLFSPSHLLDLLNQHLLISPVGSVLIMTALICLPSAFPVRNRTFQFLLLLSLSQLLFGFVVDPALGAARDWDLFSTVGLGYTVLALFVFFRLLKEKPNFGYLAVVLVGASLYSTAPWIAINAGESRSLRRFENLLDIDAKRSANGHFILIRHFESRGMNLQAKERTQKYKQAFPELDLIVDASDLAKAGELDKAEQMFLEAKRLAPKLAQVHNNLGKVYLDRGELYKAEEELKEAVRLNSSLTSPYINLADLCLLRKDYDGALQACRKAIRLKTDYPQTYSNAATVYLMRDDLKRAEAYYRDALNLDPRFVDPYVGLGDIYNRRGTSDKAVRMYREALKLDPNLAKVRYRLGMTYLSLNATQEATEQLEWYLRISPQGDHAIEVEHLLEQLRQKSPVR